MMHRTCEDGNFEIMMKDAALYEKTNDALMMTAPGFKPTEVALSSYMNNDITIKMEPLNYEPVIQTEKTLPMVRIPGGFFRMGLGLMDQKIGATQDERDYDTRHCWPVQTVSIPSFYFSQYNQSPRFRQELCEL